MRRYFTLLLILIAIESPTIFAQTIQVPGPPEEVLRRQAMETALEAWRKTDTGIERVLFQKQSDDMLKRIATSAESRNRVEDARLAYVQVLLTQARHQLSTLESLRTPGAAMPVDEIRSNIQSRLDSLTTEEMRLRRLLKEKDPAVLPERQTLINEQIEEQLKDIANLRENLYQQKELLETLRIGDERRKGVAQALLDHQRQIVQLLESESDRTTEDRTLWQNYYAALKKLVVERASAKETTSHKPAKSVETRTPGAKP